MLEQFNTEAKLDSLGFQVKYISGGLGEFQTENWRKGLLNPRPRSTARPLGCYAHWLCIQGISFQCCAHPLGDPYGEPANRTRAAYYSEIAHAQTCIQGSRILNEMNL